MDPRVAVEPHPLLDSLPQMDWLHYVGQFCEGRESEERPMADPKHPRHFGDDFKRQIVEPINAGKPKSDVM